MQRHSLSEKSVRRPVVNQSRTEGSVGQSVWNCWRTLTGGIEVVPVKEAYSRNTSWGFGPNITNTSIMPLSDIQWVSTWGTSSFSLKNDISELSMDWKNKRRVDHNRTQPQASSVYKLTCCVMSKCSTESIIGYVVLLSLGNFATITVTKKTNVSLVLRVLTFVLSLTSQQPNALWLPKCTRFRFKFIMCITYVNAEIKRKLLNWFQWQKKRT